MGIPIGGLKKRWMKEPGFKDGYDALEAEFTLASMLIEARTKANLSQQELAKKWGLHNRRLRASKAALRSRACPLSKDLPKPPACEFACRSNLR